MVSDEALSALLGHPLPHHKEAEEALLGAILANHHVLEDVMGWLKPEHFFYPVHGRIYGATLKMAAGGRWADPVTLRHSFESDGDLDEAGGADYLVALAGSMIDPAAAKEYGRTIRDFSLRRDLIRASWQTAQDALSGADWTMGEELLDVAEGRLAALRTGEERGRLRPFSEVIEELHEHWSDLQAGTTTPLLLGLGDLDKIIGGMMAGDVCVLAGRPGSGKSAGLRSIAANVANAGKAVALFSQEMTQAQVAMGIAQQQGPQVEPSAMRSGKVDKDLMSRLVQYTTSIRNLPIWIDDSSGLTIESFRSRVRALKRERPDLALVGIDYLQLMSPPPGREMAGTLGVEYLSKNIKVIAKEEKVAVLLLSQLNRAVESRDGKRPTMSDLRSSGSIEQDADAVVLIFREEYYHQQEMPTSRTSHDDGSFARWEEKLEEIRGVAELIVAKNRFGTPGVVRVHFDGARGLFTNLAPGYLNGRGATHSNGHWHGRDDDYPSAY